MKTNGCRADSRAKTSGLKAQANMMEYVLMTFFMFAIIVALIFFLSGWQTMQTQVAHVGEYLERGVDIADSILNSPYFIKGNEMIINPMLDDSKLMTLNTTDGICDMLENIFGANWFVEIRVFDYSSDGSDGAVECTLNSYPDCNLWTICKQDRDSVLFVLPVNVYRKAWLDADTGVRGRTDIGILTVGVYA